MIVEYLVWEAHVDQGNNTVWEANSKIVYKGQPLKYRIFQRLSNNRITYVEDSDYELWLDRRQQQIWFDIYEAKYDMSRASKDILI